MDNQARKRARDEISRGSEDVGEQRQQLGHDGQEQEATSANNAEAGYTMNSRRPDPPYGGNSYQGQGQPLAAGSAASDSTANAQPGLNVAGSGSVCLPSSRLTYVDANPLAALLSSQPAAQRQLLGQPRTNITEQDLHQSLQQLSPIVANQTNLVTLQHTMNLGQRQQSSQQLELQTQQQAVLRLLQQCQEQQRLQQLQSVLGWGTGVQNPLQISAATPPGLLQLLQGNTPTRVDAAATAQTRITPAQTTTPVSLAPDAATTSVPDLLQRRHGNLQTGVASALERVPATAPALGQALVSAPDAADQPVAAALVQSVLGGGTGLQNLLQIAAATPPGLLQLLQGNVPTRVDAAATAQTQITAAQTTTPLSLAPDAAATSVPDLLQLRHGNLQSGVTSALARAPTTAPAVGQTLVSAPDATDQPVAAALVQSFLGGGTGIQNVLQTSAATPPGLLQLLQGNIPTRVDAAATAQTPITAAPLAGQASLAPDAAATWLLQLLQGNLRTGVASASALAQVQAPAPAVSQALVSAPEATDQPVAAPPSVAPVPAAVPSTPRLTGREPVVLYISADEQSLSPYQCLTRKQMHLFEAKKVDVEAGAQGRNKPIVLGQVGIRCLHCAHLPLKQRLRASTYYPAKLHGLYQAGQNITNGHLCSDCRCLPNETRARLMKLQTKKSAPGGGKHYWSEAAESFGVFEDEHGLRFSLKRPISSDGSEGKEPPNNDTVENEATEKKCE